MPASPGTIVVGVDGSAAALAALRWAADEAVRRAGRLLVVRAIDATDDEHRTAEHRVLDASVHAVLGETPPIPTERRIRLGQPHRVLLAAADGADLLVVGARGHSTLPGRILGSTAISVARGSDIPVVVVPAPVEAVGTPLAERPVETPPPTGRY